MRGDGWMRDEREMRLPTGEPQPTNLYISLTAPTYVLQRALSQEEAFLCFLLCGHHRSNWSFHPPIEFFTTQAHRKLCAPLSRHPMRRCSWHISYQFHSSFSLGRWSPWDVHPVAHCIELEPPRRRPPPDPREIGLPTATLNLQILIHLSG